MVEILGKNCIKMRHVKATNDCLVNCSVQFFFGTAPTLGLGAHNASKTVVSSLNRIYQNIKY